MSRSALDPPVQEIADPPSVRIVEAIAAAQGADTTEVEPLYGEVDLEAVDDLVANSRGDLRVQLTVAGYGVEVLGDGSVEVH